MTDPPSCVFYLSNPSSLPEALFSYLVKAVEYETLSVQSSTAARSWMAESRLYIINFHTVLPLRLLLWTSMMSHFHSVEGR